MKILAKLCALAIFLLTGGFSTAFAADGAVILFRDGVVAEVRDGWKQLMDGMRDRKDGDEKSSVVELNLDGNSFFVDLEQVLVLCKEPCRSFAVRKQDRR